MGRQEEGKDKWEGRKRGKDKCRKMAVQVLSAINEYNDTTVNGITKKTFSKYL
jgi:hypothetical protein